MVLRKIWFISLLMLTATHFFAQVIPENRRFDWQNAGLNQKLPTFKIEIAVENFGIVGNGSTNNSPALNNLLRSAKDTLRILNFPAGNFIFESDIVLKSNCVLKGAGADRTKFIFANVGENDLIATTGTVLTDTVKLRFTAAKGQKFIETETNSGLRKGDWIYLFQNDASLVTSTWAEFSTGQLLQIDSADRRKLFFTERLNQIFSLAKSPRLVKIQPVRNVGIECLSIESRNETTLQTRNIHFQNAVNCWVRGVESYRCNFAHVSLNHSAQCEVSGSYFHDAFDYGSGGKGYGVVMEFGAAQNLVENNIFEHLRHSVLLQAGANTNVIGYNYSLRPFWTDVILPSDAAGDMVLHGNYPFGNLFEGNVCQNIVVDDSHGSNGPFNTFFRNRTESYGIFMNASPASDSLNFVGNLVIKPADPTILTRITLNGAGHLSHGNYFRGDIIPTGTDNLLDTSYYLVSRPEFFKEMPDFQWFGIPDGVTAKLNPPKKRYESGSQKTVCADVISSVAKEESLLSISIYPNPSSFGSLTMEFNDLAALPLTLKVFDATGKMCAQRKLDQPKQQLDFPALPSGIYFLKIRDNKGRATVLKWVKF